MARLEADMNGGLDPAKKMVGCPQCGRNVPESQMQYDEFMADSFCDICTQEQEDENERLARLRDEEEEAEAEALD